MYDFHTHTFLSDGVLAPTELIRRAIHNGYRVMAVTDHVGPGQLGVRHQDAGEGLRRRVEALGHTRPTRCGNHIRAKRRYRI